VQRKRAEAIAGVAINAVVLVVLTHLFLRRVS
jgi:hypothetical protein